MSARRRVQPREQFKNLASKLITEGRLAPHELVSIARTLIDFAGTQASHYPTEKNFDNLRFRFGDSLRGVHEDVGETLGRWTATGSTSDPRRCSCGGRKMQGYGICETCMST